MGVGMLSGPRANKDAPATPQIMAPQPQVSAAQTPPSVITPALPQDTPLQANMVFDVPSLLGAKVDAVRANLADAASRDIEPVSGRERVSFTKDGETLLATYDPKTRRVTSLFILGTDRRKLLRVGNLTWGGNYDIEFVERANGSGLRITTLGSREAPEPDASEESTQSPRTWTDTSGNHQVMAEFVGCGSGVVTLKMVGGKTFTIRIEQLSEEDQEWIRKRLN
jgi:hypothetical protein